MLTSRIMPVSFDRLLIIVLMFYLVSISLPRYGCVNFYFIYLPFAASPCLCI